MNYLPSIFGSEDNADDQRVTRSRAAQLQLPIPGIGRGVPRSRTPSPVPRVGGQFFGDTTSTMADSEAIKAAAIAAAEAAVRAMGTTTSKPRKPELPDFDRKNVEIWIKRVEAAYIRVGIVNAKEKFAHLETKFKVDFDPQINEYLFGEATTEKWNEFVSYLHSTYGRTKRQEAATVLDGVKRDGRRPTQLRSFIYDRIGNISIDELVREMVMRELPIDVQRSLQERADKMSSRELADAADAFFDQDGKPIHASAQTVNAVEEEDNGGEEDTDINALNFRQKPRGRFQQNFPQKSTFPKQPNGARPFTPAFTQNAPTTQARKPPGKPLCIKHRKFKEKAYSCEPGCPKWEEFNAANARSSGDGMAGRRM